MYVCVHPHCAFSSTVSGPNLPGVVDVVSFTEGTISLDWSKPRGRVDGYNVTYCNGTCRSVVTSLRNLTLSSLRDGSLYNVSLRSQSHGVSSGDAWSMLQPTSTYLCHIVTSHLHDYIWVFPYLLGNIVFSSLAFSQC